MEIFFLGQRGIPARRDLQSSDEKRVETLAHLLQAAGYKIYVACNRQYARPFIRHFGSIELIYKQPSLYLLRSLWSVWQIQPDVIHVHGWRAAALVPLTAFLSPDSLLFWTVSRMPKRSLKAFFVAKMANYAFDAVSTPSRRIQYELLVQYNLRTIYIPDGYAQPQIPAAKVTSLGLRKGQYVVALVKTVHDLRWVVKAYKSVKTRKPVVIFSKNKSLQKLRKRYPYLRFIDILPGRLYNSVVRQAAVVIAGEKQDPEVLLQAMDGGRAIIATTTPLYEETLGTSAQFVRTGDAEQLSKLLASLVKDSKAQKKWGKKAANRAQNHFKWQRCFKEYLHLYRKPTARKVPLDSLIPPSWNQRAALELTNRLSPV